ncbi:hypothetical protein DM02DRAFT_616666 [Periconia macrospinosa]|uniref:CBF1-interacting co-repressor CIR N-terminal domain-containing protein n=1 Tax=Periconia macrospinosa TaxID=97972 RepID=A0A2V1DG99_9PLEO|nr:hypothetical protein DM02DRAFT_616666 [Periconia macrospinosa]
MPLHLLGKKSWNVYNPANIARVKADEAAAAAREAADDERRQELDAARRAALLRGRTPPPLLEEDDTRADEKLERSDGHQRKRRKLVGEDDTDMDIRLATSAAAPKNDNDARVKTMRLRKPDSDAPLHDPAGNINLFPIDVKEVVKREKNAEAEKEKKRKERAFEDQYTMRFSNAAGKGGLDRPWYTSQDRQNAERDTHASDNSLDYPGFNDKDVWGNEDPRRKEREQARIKSNDPLAFMNQAQAQLKRSQDDKKKWAKERDRELRELRASQEIESRTRRHRKRKDRVEEGEDDASHTKSDRRARSEHSRHKDHHHHHSREKRRSRDGATEHRRSRSPSYDRDRNRYARHSSHRHRSDRDRDPR